MRKKLKRLISAAMCTVMLCGMMPANVSAADKAKAYSGSNKGAQDYLMWSQPMTSYMTECADGTLMRVQYVESSAECVVEYYDRSYTLLRTKSIPLELPIFGGFHETDTNYYLLTGQINTKDDPEVIRLTKYDKNWNRIDSAAATRTSDIAIPFKAGCPRMDSDGKYLIVRTSREIIHQSNATVMFDTDNMEVAQAAFGGNSVGIGYVSHSLNQFIKIEDGKVVAVDHGDSDPKAIVLCKYRTDISTGEFLGIRDSVEHQNVVNFPIARPGNEPNATGGSIGGFEISDSSYLIAGNNVHAESQKWNDDTRNVYVASVARDNIQNVTQHWITSYEEGDGTTSTPQMVKISDNRFLVLWERGTTVYYTECDGTGTPSGTIYCMEKDADLSDCAPIVIDNKVMWYTWEDETVTFYEIGLDDITKAKATTVTGDTKEVEEFCTDGKHTVKHVAKVDATCTEAGLIECWQCEVCGQRFADQEGTQKLSEEEFVIPAKGHDFETVEVDEAAQMVHIKCSVCGLEETKTMTTRMSVSWRMKGSTGRYFDTPPKDLKVGDVLEVVVGWTPYNPGEKEQLKVSISDEEALSWKQLLDEGKLVTGEVTINKPGVVTITMKTVLNPKIEKTYTIETACSHEMEHVAEVPATCTEKGNMEYWTCKVCNQNFADEAGTTKAEEVETPALGHKYGEPEFTWKEDHTCEAKATCERCGDVQTLECKVTSDSKDAVCEEGGEVTYTASCTFEGKEYTDTKTEEVPALGHNSGKPEFTWAKDNTCKMSVKCTVCGKEVFAEACKVTSKTTDATCEKAGATVYTASCTFEGKEYTDTKTVEIPALGHKYGEPEFTWKEDHTCEAKATCERCGDVQTSECKVTSDSKDAVCEEGGEVTYTASCTFEGKEYTDTKTEEVPALGHNSGKPEFTWAKDNTCKMSVKCTVCGKEVFAEACKVTSKTIDATCEKAGATVYTASCTFEGKEYTDTKTVEIAALGHKYGEPEFTWKEDHTCEAKATCERCGYVQTSECEVTIEAKDAVCEEGGTAKYTAKVVFDGKEYTDVKTEEIPALGHKYSEPTFEWAEDHTCVLSVKCTVCGDVAFKEECEVTSDTTAATCEKAGKTVYTATITYEGKEYTDTKSVEIPALGHTYGKPEFTWNEDHTCEAQVTCGRCGNSQNLKCEVTSESQDAVCEEGGKITYTAVCTFEEKEYTDTKTEEVPALGHKYEEPEFEWTKDNTCTMSVKCAVCGNVAFAEECKVTSETTEATCEEAGKTVYTATIVYEGKEYTDTKMVEIPATGHKMGEWEITKKPTLDEEGERQSVCEICGHVVKENIARLEPGKPEKPQKPEKPNKPGNSKDETVQTGDTSPIALAVFGLVAAVLLAGAGLVLRKRRV